MSEVIEYRLQCNEGKFCWVTTVKEETQAADLDNISVELFEALCNCRIDKIATLFKVILIYLIYTDIFKSIFMVLPLKQETKKCELKKTTVA